jgi:three-Cys-motif partner protein
MTPIAESKPFIWKGWEVGTLPPLGDHSEKKLELIREYLVLYLQILLANAHGKPLQEVTLIDGFAGGGVYQEQRKGSPLVILEAVEEAMRLVNLGREKPVTIVPICYFIEEDPDAAACLEHQLKLAGYGPRIGKTVHIRRATFAASVPEIIEDVRRRHPQGGNRTIFLLDQCGYTDVPAALIKNIDIKLNGRAEFIINFSIGWFGDFFSAATASNYQGMIKRMGLEGHLDVNRLLSQRVSLGGHWKHAVESHIGRGYHSSTGIKFFSPFYIEPHDNHRGYWLLHLAQNQRARSAMMQIHWSKANRSKHYGPLGYDILSYKSDLDPTLYLKGMTFDDSTRTKCRDQLAQDYARLVRDRFQEGLPYADLADRTCNDTIADNKLLGDVLWQLYGANEIEILSPTGKAKRALKFNANDIIRVKRQLIIPGMGGSAIPLQRPRRTSAR